MPQVPGHLPGDPLPFSPEWYALKWLCRLDDETIVGTAENEADAIVIGCAFYTAIMVTNPQRPYLVRVYDPSKLLVATIGRND